MMDWSSVIIYDGLVVGGAILVLMMGLWTLSVESSTVSTSDPSARTQTNQVDLRSLLKAA